MVAIQPNKILFYQLMLSKQQILKSHYHIHPSHIISYQLVQLKNVLIYTCIFFNMNYIYNQYMRISLKLKKLQFFYYMG